MRLVGGLLHRLLEVARHMLAVLFDLVRLVLRALREVLGSLFDDFLKRASAGWVSTELLQFMKTPEVFWVLVVQARKSRPRDEGDQGE